MENAISTPEEIKVLRCKAKVLELFCEMSETVGTVFDLKEIFIKATDLILQRLRKFILANLPRTL